MGEKLGTGERMSKITNQSEVTSQYSLPDTSTKQSRVQSNMSSTEYMTTSFIKLRSTAKNFGESNDEIEQTLVLTNNSEFKIFGVNIKENIGADATFKEGSVTIDNQPQPTFNIVNGFDLTEDIDAGATKTIKFTIVINNSLTSDILNMNSTITYSVNEITDLTENSNIVTIDLTNNLITIKKTSDKTAVIKGDTLLFQNVIKNEGSMTNTNVVFKDEIPAGTTFKEGSVKVNEEVRADADPAVGIALEDMAPNAEITVTFEVTIN